MVSWQKFHVKKEIQSLGRLSKLTIVKFFSRLHAGRFWISFFLVNLFAFQFGRCVINIKMMLWQKFHGIKYQCLSFQEAFKSWQFWNFSHNEFKNNILIATPLYAITFFIIDKITYKHGLGASFILESNHRNNVHKWSNPLLAYTMLWLWIYLHPRTSMKSNMPKI